METEILASTILGALRAAAHFTGEDRMSNLALAVIAIAVALGGGAEEVGLPEPAGAGCAGS